MSSDLAFSLCFLKTDRTQPPASQPGLPHHNGRFSSFLELLCQDIWHSANPQFSIIFMNTREGHKGQLGMPNGPLEAGHLLNMQEEPELNSQQHAGKKRGTKAAYMNIHSVLGQ